MKEVKIDGWKFDDEFSPFPEGARDKYALIAPASVDDERVIPSHRYLMKFSNPRYPIQFWSELIAREIGVLSAVPVPDCFLAIDTATELPGSLISWFYGDCIEETIKVDGDPIVDEDEYVPNPLTLPVTHSLYVPGSSYMVKQIPDYNLKTGKQHNLKHLGYLITRFRQRWSLDFWPFWAKLLTFDAIIGNTDRHQDNWGVLWRRNSDGAMAPRFAPAFDNGTSLLHEILETKLDQFDDSIRLARYVERGRHHMRNDVTDEKAAGHITLLQRLVERRPELHDIVLKTAEFEIDRLRDILLDMSNFDCIYPLSSRRAEAICKVIEQRKNLILKIPLGQNG